MLRLRNAQEAYARAGQESGEACHQSAETTHDNFPYEQAMRDMDLYGRMIRNCIEILNEATVVESLSISSKTVQIGHVVKVANLERNCVEWYRIGSFAVPEVGGDGTSAESPFSISYAGKMGSAFLGRKINDSFRLFDLRNNDFIVVILELTAQPPVV